jgi:ABC-type multidrug transport system fused ATPase/permease subunit
VAVAAGSASIPGVVTRLTGNPVVIALRACWHASRRLTATYVAVSVGRGIVPNLLYLTTSALAAALVNARDDATLALVIALITAAFVGIQVGEPIANALGHALGRRVDTDLQRRVLEASLEPATVAHLESDRVRHAIGVARDWESSSHPPSEAVQGLGYFLTATVWALVSGAVLISFVWWAPLIVMGGWITMTWWGTRFREGPALARIRSATSLRRAAYYRDLGFEGSSAREARIFGLGDWLRGRSEDAWLTGMTRVWDARAATRTLGFTGVSVLVGGYFLLFGLIMQAAFAGSIDVAHATLYVQCCGGIAFLWMPSAILALREATAPVPQVLAVLGEPGAAGAGRTGTGQIGARPAGLAGRDARGMPARGIAFRHLSFTYPGQPTPVYRDLDLEIHAGQSIAIVGANGAGKTTLVKLLAGLLEPDAGTIEVDGVALADLDRATWQHRVAAIFQDYVRYPFSVRDNVGLGETSPDRDLVIRALDRALASDVVSALPDGIDTPLAREFGGVDLSGGQWQRVALARALYAVSRGASVLVLDEPTAQLDIRAEAELFDRFLELTAGLTTVLISHRFSSVRHAQRIVVLEHGRIVEDGSHADLVAARGLYARMFREQARHFDADA